MKVYVVVEYDSYSSGIEEMRVFSTHQKALDYVEEYKRSHSEHWLRRWECDIWENKVDSQSIDNTE